MSITIAVSEKTEQIIREKAEENGKDIADFVGEFIEDNFADKEKSRSKQTVSSESEPARKFMRMRGMFSSGKTDMSERMHELLYTEDFDPAKGFSLRQ